MAKTQCTYKGTHSFPKAHSISFYLNPLIKATDLANSSLVALMGLFNLQSKFCTFVALLAITLACFFGLIS